LTKFRGVARSSLRTTDVRKCTNMKDFTFSNHLSQLMLHVDSLMLELSIGNIYKFPLFGKSFYAQSTDLLNEHRQQPLHKVRRLSLNICSQTEQYLIVLGPLCPNFSSSRILSDHPFSIDKQSIVNSPDLVTEYSQPFANRYSNNGAVSNHNRPRFSDIKNPASNDPKQR
jgi:hypothetical protein